MDHLLYPQLSQYPPLDIPYLSEVDSPHLAAGFCDFASEQGWVTEERKWKKLMKRGCTLSALDAVAGYAQAWLYFELLDTFMDDKVEREMFKKLSAPGEQACLTSEALPDLLTRWRDYMLELDSPSKWSTGRPPARKDELSNLVSHLNRCLLIAMNATEDLDRLPCPPGCLLPPVIASIKALLESLKNALQTPRLILKMPQQSWLLNGALALKPRLIKAGYCPSRLDQLYSQHSTATLYYLSGLRSQESRVRSHELCTSTSCAVVHVDMDTYRTKHSDDCDVLSLYSTNPDCQHIGPDEQTIRGIIESGDIPIVSLTLDRHGELHMTLRPSRTVSGYIAISHVWADGLGNPTANSLPRCQLRLLYDRLYHTPQEPGWAQLYHPAGMVSLFREDFQGFRWNSRKTHKNYEANFWMDTLCIPPYNQGQNDIRQKALGAMGQVYAGAESVLVLDEGLQNIQHSYLESHEVSAHIISSAWMTRCWTYQEGILARRLFFQFQDGLYDIMKESKQSIDVNSNVKKTKVLMDHDETSFGLFLWFHEMPALVETGDLGGFKSMQPPHHSFMDIWNGLTERTTTKPQDRTLILAVLSDNFISDMFQLEESSRLGSVLSSQKYLPMTIFTLADYEVEKSTGKITWQPPAPGNTRLTPLLGWSKVHPYGFTFDPLDNICLNEDDDDCSRFIIVQAGVVRNRSPIQIKIEGEKDIFILSTLRSNEPGNPGDDDSREACFLVPGTSKGLTDLSLFSGAHFQIMDSNSGDLTLRPVGSIICASYQPIRDSGETPETTIVHGTLMDIQKKVFIEHKFNNTETVLTRRTELQVGVSTLNFPVVRYCIVLICLLNWYLMLSVWTRDLSPMKAILQGPWIDIIAMVRILLACFEGVFWTTHMSNVNHSRWVMSYNRWTPDSSRMVFPVLAPRVAAIMIVTALTVGVTLLLVGCLSDPAGNGNLAGWVGSSLLIEIPVRICASFVWSALLRNETLARNEKFRWLRRYL
ncbi:hypothetical protein F4805DRAFT_456171 [Annulohypoxylon moriforme]|nr:hypothetical protein F4805DRAFT_456171 [Annulohypoxylon moriforme]